MTGLQNKQYKQMTWMLTKHNIPHDIVITIADARRIHLKGEDGVYLSIGGFIMEEKPEDKPWVFIGKTSAHDKLGTVEAFHLFAKEWFGINQAERNKVKKNTIICYNYQPLY